MHTFLALLPSLAREDTLYPIMLLSIFDATPATHQNFLLSHFNYIKAIPWFCFLCFLLAFNSSRKMANVTPQRKLSTTIIHIMALDGIINVNSLFTLGLFLGLTLYPNPADNLVSGPCSAGPAVAENLVSYHVYSFSSFLFSSLIASALKQAIKISNGGRENEAFGVSVTIVRVNLMILRVGTLVSSVGSVLGCGFLMVALVNLIQIKLGILGCKSFYTLAAISPLVTLVPLALVIYVGLVLYAFSR